MRGADSSAADCARLRVATAFLAQERAKGDSGDVSRVLRVAYSVLDMR